MMTRSNFLILSIIFISTLLCSCGDQLNRIRSDGAVNYKNKVSSCIYFETKQDVKEFVKSVVSDIGNVQHYDSVSSGLKLGWVNTEFALINKQVDIEIGVENNFETIGNKLVYDRSVITILVFDTKGNNLIESQWADQISTYFQDKVNKYVGNAPEKR